MGRRERLGIRQGLEVRVAPPMQVGPDGPALLAVLFASCLGCVLYLWLKACLLIE
jgi:hypothetical protein